MDVIARTGFGYELNTQKDPNNKFTVMAKKIMNANIKNPFVFVLCKYCNSEYRRISFICLYNTLNFKCMYSPKFTLQEYSIKIYNL